MQVVLEGSAEAPSTADGIRVIELLQRAGISFQCVDIGGNENMREALKQEFRWERFPQVYAQGELVGDVSILEVHTDLLQKSRVFTPKRNVSFSSGKRGAPTGWNGVHVRARDDDLGPFGRALKKMARCSKSLRCSRHGRAQRMDRLKRKMKTSSAAT